MASIQAGDEMHPEKERLLGSGTSEESCSSTDDEHPPNGMVGSTSVMIAREHHPHATTSNESLMHLLKGMIGSGILAMPIAIKHAGLWVGTIGIFVIGAIALHCMSQLVNCSHILCNRLGRSSMSYGDVVEQSFKTGPAWARPYTKAATVAITLFILITQFGFCIVYVLFISDNMEQAIEVFTGAKMVHGELVGGFDMSIYIYMFLTLVALIPLALVRELRTLAPLSMLANAIVLLGLAIVLYWTLGQDLASWSSLPAFNSWSSLPLYFGTTIYAFEGIGVVLPIENKMKYPKDFVGLTGVMTTSIVITTCLYTAIGFYGYIAAGESVKGSITLNLPLTPFYSSVRIFFVIAMYITYALQFYVPLQIIWPNLEPYLKTRKSKFIGEYCFRIFLVICTFAFAAVIPHLDLMISLIGAMASSSIALIFPPILETLVVWDSLGKCRWILVKNVLIACFGFLGFVAGTAATLVEIVNTF